MDNFDSFPERDGELELPGDLAAMAEQLTDDAQRLAACYPPQYGPVMEVVATVASVRPHQNRTQRWWLAGCAAGGLVALGLVGALLVGELTSDPQPSGDQLATTTSAVKGSLDQHPSPRIGERASPAVVVDAAERTARELVVPANAFESAPPITPAVFQRGVTGPEVEGWIDLALDTESLEF